MQINLNKSLPIYQKHLEIIEAVKNNQVIIVAGATGSGKTTQLPQLCLAAGRGNKLMIGHTQPRRIAAKTLAARISEELQVPLGQQVGYKIRFNDHTAANTIIKVMTEGILLNEVISNKLFEPYDTLIIDEAHERSLNIDFILGLIKLALQQRKDLKVIITSATIDVVKFSKFFSNAPIIEVSGRTYPVTISYQPELEDLDKQQNLLQAILSAIKHGPGDVLVFFSGERDIKEAYKLIKQSSAINALVLPLYARLSNNEQQKIFTKSNLRKIILATNIAETSLTLPGIKYVIDTGMARISKYNYKTQVQWLPIEPISKSSADQRAGRAGRVASGVCIRMYAKQDYELRPEFTTPEILRTNLAAVILQMLFLKLGDIDKFPFIEPPDPRYIKDGYRTLEYLQAITKDKIITKFGKQIAQLPLDPKLAAILLSAEKYGALQEATIIVSGLSIIDPRIRPFGNTSAADQCHARFKDKKSDFLSYLTLWQYLQENYHNLSKNKFKKLCEAEYLSVTNVYAWFDTYKQFYMFLKDFGHKFNQEPADYTAIHKSLLTGFMVNTANWFEDKTYKATKGRRLTIFPGSGLFKSLPKWLVCFEIVATNKVYAKTVAKIEPEWLVNIAKHLLKYSYTQPYWNLKAGKVDATETASFFGLILYSNKKVDFTKVDEILAREIMIQQGLVEQNFNINLKFYSHNKKLIAEISDLENKTRRKDLLISEQQLYAWYAKHIPENVASQKSLEAWLKNMPENTLIMQQKDLLAADLQQMDIASKFPDFMEMQNYKFKLQYTFDPSNQHDGIRLIIPIAKFNLISLDRVSWGVYGMLLERITALIKSLPKKLRTNFIPVVEYATAVLERVKLWQGDLLQQIALMLQEITGIIVKKQDFNEQVLDKKLQIEFCVVNDLNQALIVSRNWDVIKNFVIDKKTLCTEENIEDVNIADKYYQSWGFVDLKSSYKISKNNVTVTLHQAIQDCQCKVQIISVATVKEQQQQHKQGLSRLLSLVFNSQTKYLLKQLKAEKTLLMHYSVLNKIEYLQQDFIIAVYKLSFELDNKLIFSKNEFTQLINSDLAKNIIVISNNLIKILKNIFEQYYALGKFRNDPYLLEQLKYMFPINFIYNTPYSWLQRIPYYLQAINYRVNNIVINSNKDKLLQQQIKPYWDLAVKHMDDVRYLEYRWLVEEFRLSLYAQHLKTIKPISAKRLNKLWEELQQ